MTEGTGKGLGGADADQQSLQESLISLAGLVTAAMGLEELLAKVAGFAAHAIPGSDGAGVALLRIDRPDDPVETTAVSRAFVRELDMIQYDITGEGPCISAAREGRTMRSGSVADDQRWPRFGPAAGRLGVHSALSLPLVLPDGVIGAINVYARQGDMFDTYAAELGEAFAVPAAVAVRNAQVLAQARRLISQLETALAHRPVIDQAIGILRSRNGCSGPEGLARLRAMSQAEHVKLIVVAERIVEQAVGRARSRRP